MGDCCSARARFHSATSRRGCAMGKVTVLPNKSKALRSGANTPPTIFRWAGRLLNLTTRLSTPSAFTPQGGIENLVESRKCSLMVPFRLPKYDFCEPAGARCPSFFSQYSEVSFRGWPILEGIFFLLSGYIRYSAVLPTICKKLRG